MRVELSELVDLVGQLVGDPNHETFSEDLVETFLDASRLRFDDIPLVSQHGSLVYIPSNLEKHWDKATQLLDSDGDALSPTISDYLNGVWEFSADISGYVSGWSYDPYAAASDLLTTRGAQLSEDIQSFSGQNGSFSYVNKSEGPLSLARRYEAQSRRAWKTVMRERVDAYSGGYTEVSEHRLWP